MPIIVFWDNESGRVFAFGSIHDAMEHAKSDFVHDFIKKDQDNIVMVGLANPIKPKVVQQLIDNNEIGMTEIDTVFVDKKLDLSDMKEVFKEDKLNAGKYYYRVYKLISRVGLGEPDTIKTLIAKLEATNLTRRKTAMKQPEIPVNRANDKKKHGFWKRTSKDGERPQTFEASQATGMKRCLQKSPNYVKDSNWRNGSCKRVKNQHPL